MNQPLSTCLATCKIEGKKKKSARACFSQKGKEKKEKKKAKLRLPIKIIINLVGSKFGIATQAPHHH